MASDQNGHDKQQRYGSTVDLLGYDDYASSLWDRIAQALDRDLLTGQLGDDPMVVGLFGEWGSGKSDLLGRIYDCALNHQNQRANRRALDNGFGLTIPVLFQPWKYEHEEHLHVPMMLHILQALKDGLKHGQTNLEKWAQSLQGPGDLVVKAMPRIVDLLEKTVLATVAVLGAGPTAGMVVGVPAAKGLAAWLPNFKKSNAVVSETVRYTDAGHYFYEIHKVLKAVTRPGQHDGYLQGIQIGNTRIAINFVVFVDDLDRCLPEKAVSVLELIKTVFNIESFAFVLALDDEVIERGIGHRYKEYALQNKKVDMPITGFEYLEKIVHLPFRLPALTRTDALTFLRSKENDLLAMYPVDRRPSAWFAPRLVLVHGERQTQFEIDLAQLVLNSFDAYVPRKLLRAVELFHQVTRIADVRGKSLDMTLGGAIDARLVMAFVLLQLFQPELYRCMRRTRVGFDVLRDNFASEELSAVFSNHELLRWACYGHPGSVSDEAFKEGYEGESNAIRTSREALPIAVGEAVQHIARLTREKRFPAQHVRLPMVERMLEHRGAQRHAFDALKLFAALHASHLTTPLSKNSTHSYFSLLARPVALDSDADGDVVRRKMTVASEVMPSGASTTDVQPNVERLSTPIVGDLVQLNDPTAVANSLMSAERRIQEDVVNLAGLRSGQMIADESATLLLAKVRAPLDEGVSPVELLIDEMRQGRQRQLLRGLLRLSPFLPEGQTAQFWSLVDGCMTLPKNPSDLADDPKLCALYADVRSALKCDQRFDPEHPWLLRERFPGHNEVDEPLPGFVRIPLGHFTMGHKSDMADNGVHVFNLHDDFFIARTLTTVAQFELFVSDGGYQAGVEIWGVQGLDWREGRFNSPGADSSERHLLTIRADEKRLEPWEWNLQRPHRSRPVCGVNWFEARAYARWLNKVMRKDIEGVSALTDYAVMLPSEPQWERAARASDLQSSDLRNWPWGDDDKNAAKLANIQASDIARACSVGVFAPNPIGLYDMAGNLSEWMDNLYAPSTDGRLRPSRDQVLFAYENAEKSSQPALRGGSWHVRPEGARCSFRDRTHPDNYINIIGFRVVLSLGE